MKHIVSYLKFKIVSLKKHHDGLYLSVFVKVHHRKIQKVE